MGNAVGGAVAKEWRVDEESCDEAHTGAALGPASRCEEGPGPPAQPLPQALARPPAWVHDEVALGRVFTRAAGIKNADFVGSTKAAAAAAAAFHSSTMIFARSEMASSEIAPLLPRGA